MCGMRCYCSRKFFIQVVILVSLRARKLEERYLLQVQVGRLSDLQVISSIDRKVSSSSGLQLASSPSCQVVQLSRFPCRQSLQVGKAVWQLDYLQSTLICIFIFSFKREKLYYRSENAPMYTFIIKFLYLQGKIQRYAISTSIIEISILVENIKMYIGDDLKQYDSQAAGQYDIYSQTTSNQKGRTKHQVAK